MPVSGKKVVSILARNGWTIVSQRGSHIKLRRGEATMIVPVHGNKDLGKGLIRSIEKQSGVKII